jgi:uncharacterized membrane protein YdjX (TVP38/TMEM64 family)
VRGVATGDPDESPPSVDPDGRQTPSVPRAAIVRFVLLIAILALAFLLFRFTPLSEIMTREKVVSLLLQLRTAWWAPLALLALFAVVSPTGLPVSPLVFAGGVVFGVRWGWIYNFAGTMLGASVSFLLARALGRELVVHLAGAKLLDKVERILERHGFWTLVRVRFLPLPFAVINFGAALAGIHLPVFLSASVFGLAPSMLIYTYFGHALFNAATGDRQMVLRNLAVVLILALALTFLVPMRRAWKKRRYGKN